MKNPSPDPVEARPPPRTGCFEEDATLAKKSSGPCFTGGFLEGNRSKISGNEPDE